MISGYDHDNFHWDSESGSEDKNDENENIGTMPQKRWENGQRSSNDQGNASPYKDVHVIMA